MGRGLKKQEGKEDRVRKKKKKKKKECRTYLEKNEREREGG
jgi:hypothetical protein